MADGGGGGPGGRPVARALRGGWQDTDRDWGRGRLLGKHYVGERGSFCSV